jgi:hypothetical protein
VTLAPDPATTLLLPLARNPGGGAGRHGDILPALPGPRVPADPAVTPVPGLPDSRRRTRRRGRHEFGHWRGRRHRCRGHDRGRRRLHDHLSRWGRRVVASGESERGGDKQRKGMGEAHLKLQPVENGSADQRPSSSWRGSVPAIRSNVLPPRMVVTVPNHDERRRRVAFSKSRRSVFTVTGNIGLRLTVMAGTPLARVLARPAMTRGHDSGHGENALTRCLIARSTRLGRSPGVTPAWLASDRTCLEGANGPRGAPTKRRPLSSIVH